MIKVWGRSNSSNVQAVMWAIGELGLDHERIDWGGKFGGNDDPEYRAMQPMGLVPAMKDGDITMFESPAIVRYLGARYGEGAFWPADAVARGQLDMWAEWAKTSLIPPLVTIFMQLVRMTPAQRNAAALAEAVGKAKTLATIIDRRLGAGPYLGGEAFTFADVMLGHWLYRYYTEDFERAVTPSLDAYYERLEKRPAFQEHVMVSYEDLRVK